MKAIYRQSVRKANEQSGSSGSFIMRKRNRSNEENEPPFINDSDEDPDLIEMTKRVKKRMPKKLKRSGLDALHDEFNLESNVKGEADNQYSDYTAPHQQLMGCKYVTKDKLESILEQELKTDDGRAKVKVRVLSVKVKKGKGSTIDEEKTWTENDVKARIEVIYEQKLKTNKRRDHVDLGKGSSRVLFMIIILLNPLKANYINNECFLIGNFVRFMNEAINNSNSIYSWRCLSTKRQRADKIDGQLKDIGKFIV